MSEPTDKLVELVRNSIAAEVEKIVVEEAIEAGKRVEKRVRAKTAEMAVSVMTHFAFERYQTDLRIIVDLDNIKKT